MRDSLPFLPEDRLKDPRYRRELLAKVEALIGVLQAARQKILSNLHSPGVDANRLRRVQGNLEGTLEVCERARRTLMSASDAGQSPRRRPGPVEPGKMSFQDYVEFSSFEEYQRLKDQGPIVSDEIRSTDLERLCDQLGEIELE